MRTLTLWATSRARAPEQLCPGSDLAIDVAPAHGLALARGVALDDYLDADTRVAADTEARTRYQRWRALRSTELTVDHVDLTKIWEVELLAQCFQPAARLHRGLPAAIGAAAPQRVLTRGLDPSLMQLVAAIGAGVGCTIDAAPRVMSTREPVPRAPQSRLAAAATLLGVPARIRGEVLCTDHWSINPVIGRMAHGSALPQPVAARLLVSGLGRRDATAVALCGGWMGVPGRRALAASRALIARRLKAAGPVASDDQLDAAIDAHALATLGRLGLETLAPVWHARRALDRGCARLAVLPFDGPEQSRMLLATLRDAGASSLLVQHGFSARLGDPDMHLVDHVAVWSERDRSLAPVRDPATVTVTGNPGAVHLLAGTPTPPKESHGRCVVLVEYPGRLTARIDGRVSMAHVAVALEALATVRPGTTVIVRPHPGDQDPQSYLTLAPVHPELRIEVDRRTPIEPLLASSDLCIGALSTATLQACVLGVPTVFLDVTGLERPWPFDGEELPSATDASSLAGVISSPLRNAREAALEALGARSDAVERVLDLIVDLAR
jgi:hypothetical protein